MNIGFFGDSYVDLQIAVWARKLLLDFKSPIAAGGIGGSSQYYAIKSWHEELAAGRQYDVAIFTFTWHERLYRERKDLFDYLRADAESRRHTVESELSNEFARAINLYREYLYDDDSARFYFELMVKYCLDLPSKHPNTKFIFLPNTEYARTLAKKHFTQGVLFDFAFETVSNNEPESTGPIGEVWDHRPGHLNPTNHNIIKNLVKDAINKYDSRIIDVDLTQFNRKANEQF